MPRDNPPHAVPASKAVFAAGAVLWRPGDDADAPEVAVIHRPRYDDWSLPKGKVDPGETEPVTAVREVAEETGYAAHLGRRLAAVSYPVEQNIKKVRYWTARAIGGEFSAERRKSTNSNGFPWPKPSRRSATRTTERCYAASRSCRPTRRRCWLSGTAPRAASPDTRVTTGTVHWTSTGAHRPSLSSDSCCLSVPTSSTPPTGHAASRRSNRWPKNSAPPSTANRC